MSLFFQTVSIVFVFISLLIQPSNGFSAAGNPQEIVAVALRHGPPQYLIDKETSQPVGFAIDIMNKVAQLSDLKVRYVVYDDWSDALEAVKNKQAVLVPNLGITADRLSLYDFTIPYETFHISAFVRSATVDIKKVSDLSGKKVGVIEKNQGLVLMREQGGSDLQIFKSLEEAFMALLSGSVDALVCPEPWISGIARLSGLEGKIKMVGNPLGEIRRAIAVRKGEPELVRKLDKAVQLLITTPEYKKIYEKWHGTPLPYWTSQRIMWTMSGLLLAGLLAMALWRYLTIARLNRELLATIEVRKKAEETLRQSEERYKTILENIEDGYYEVDLKGNFTFFNESFRKIVGYTKEELLGMNYRRYSDQENAQKVLMVYNQVYRTGEPLKWFEWEIIRKDGARRLIAVSVSLIKDTSNEPTGFRGIIRDETDRKEAEEALQKSEERYRNILESIEEGYYEVDITGNLTSFNDSLCDMLGYSRDELMGLNSRRYTDEENAQKLYKAFNQVYRTGIPVKGFDWQVINKNGRTGFGEISVSPVRDREGNIIGFRGIARDVTERKHLETALRESEKRYRDLFENATLAIFQSTFDNQAITINPMFARMFGYESPEEFLASVKNVATDVFADPRRRSEIIRLKTENPALNTFENLYRRKDGSTFWGRLNVRATKDLEGNILYYEGFIEDINERKQAEEEKRKLEDQLQRAEKMEALGTLAGGVAHDLNNVLGIIVGYSELLLYDLEASSPLRPGLVNILGGSQRAAAIVQDLLTLARRGISGRQILNLNKIILDCQKLPEFENLSSYHPLVKIKTDLEPDLLNISGSALHLGKTLFNLVSNASEAMEKGGTLTIKTSNQYLDRPIQGYDEVREGDYVVLSVSDTGDGIPAADLKHIFEPFYTKKVMGRSGTGLGLAVVWGTVKDHYGYINVQSEEGKGSTFTIYFPVTRQEITSEEVLVPISEYLGKGESLLIVDDVKGQRDLATTMLRKLNYNVTSVESGERAVAYLIDHKVDLIVLDMIMDPGMDGLETYQRVLEIHPQQKAIIVSGFSETERVNTAQALGAGPYVRKPYVLEKIGLAVRQELDKE
jgi:two-component system, cell cycle sensor histidine kinase and response regulator CckA